jgi:protein-tyrosine phosphatase
MSGKKVRVLFVCLGNICRSPTAQGVFEQLLIEAGWDSRVEVDSAGTYGYHAGQPPDERAQAAALIRGIDLSGQRARKIRVEDFLGFDYVLAMDTENLRDLQHMEPEGHGNHVGRLLDFVDSERKDVPDPYYGGAQGFDLVLDVLDEGNRAFLDYLISRHS